MDFCRLLGQSRHRFATNGAQPEGVLQQPAAVKSATRSG